MKWKKSAKLLMGVAFMLAIGSMGKTAAKAATIDITPSGSGITSGTSGDGWSYGNVAFSDFGTTSGVTITGDNCTITGTNSNCMIYVTSSVRHLTLKDCNLTAKKNFPGIWMKGTYETEIEIKGKNSFTTSQDSYGMTSCALFTSDQCSYTFTGDGIVLFAAMDAIGIYEGNITIDGPEVDVYGDSQGIRTSGNFLMKSGKLYIVTPTSSSNGAVKESYGVSADCGVTISGGYTNISSGNASIHSTSFVHITGGTNELKVDTRKEEGFPGILSTASVEITGGTTTITTPANTAVSGSDVTISTNTLKTVKYDATGVNPVEPDKGEVTTLSAPEGVSAKLNNYSSCSLSWNPVSGASYYEIWRADSLNVPMEKQGESTDTTFTDTGLSGSSIYYYCIRACSENTNTNASAYSSVVKVNAAPAPPAKVRVKKKGNRLKISWKKCKNVTGYKVYISTKADSGYKCVKTLKKASATSYTKKGIKKGKTYYVKIRSYYKGNGRTLTSDFSKTVRKK